MDAAYQSSSDLLSSAMEQFGYALQFSSVNETLNMLKVFVLQQTASGHPPILIVENAHTLNPTSLHLLCELAKLKIRQHSALRMVLSSDRSLSSIIDAPAMQGISKRMTGSFNLGTMSQRETIDYVYAKLRSGGCFDPQNVVPKEVCDEVYRSSQGWPGIVDRLLLLALSQAQYCPIEIDQIGRPVVPDATEGGLAGKEDEKGSTGVSDDAEPPSMYVTFNGETVDEIVMDQPRLLIGRSDHNDLCIDSKFLSRHHALLVRQGSSTLLMDLNSSNGTFVNSRRISNQVLQHDDVISVGQHGIKFVDPHASDRDGTDADSFTDTVIMKNLEDMRRMLARENTQVLSVPKESGGDSDN